MNLSDALDRLFEGEDFDHRNWRNPIRPYFVSGITQTPWEAYQNLPSHYKRLIANWLGHKPRRAEE